jgi:molybdopterin molybdotransferase
MSENSPLLSLATAIQRLQSTITPLSGSEIVPLAAATGRILAEDLLSPMSVPGFVNAAMDGYAINSRDLPSAGEKSLRLVGTSLAGNPYWSAVQRGEAVRIMTGAALPDGTDTVVMQEKVSVDGENVTLSSGHKRGENVRHPGEDITLGATVLARGRRLIPADIGLAASLGIAELRVVRPLRIAIFSTGDELVAPGRPLEEGQIYNSNRYTLLGLLQQPAWQVHDLGMVSDDLPSISATLHEAAAIADVIITSGGVSVGDADYVKQALQALGSIEFWKINIKPGKPLACGQIGSSWFFGLPGNPVSALVTAYQVVIPALRTLSGESLPPPLRLRVKSATALKKSPDRLDFQRGILGYNDEGELVVRPTGPQGSHILSSMSLANCFIVLEAERGPVAAGEWVEVEPFYGVLQ